MLVGVVDAGGAVIHRRVDASAGLSADELLARSSAELRIALEARPGVAAVGLGVPCIVDRERGVCVSASHLPLIGRPAARLVAERLGLPVVVDNDANAGRHRRAAPGAARGAENVVMLTIGTGIGGGLILDGAPLSRLERRGGGARPRRRRHRRPALPGQLPQPRLHRVARLGHRARARGGARPPRAPGLGPGRARRSGGEIDGTRRHRARPGRGRDGARRCWS